MSTIVENLSAHEKREALELVCRSHTFARSDRLKNLLRFICEAEIEGRAGDLKEYSIGIEALGKPDDFSPGEDSSVRSRAYELRKKLEKFYATEAPDAPVRVEIPKGSYLPHFFRLTEPAVSVAPVRDTSIGETAVLQTLGPQDLPEHAPKTRARWAPLMASFFAGIVVAAAAFAVWTGVSSREQPPHVWTRELEAIWAPMLNSPAPILVSFQNRFFLHIGPLNVRDWTVDSIDAVEASVPLMRVKQFFNAPQVYENRDYIDFGSANAVFQLSRLLATRKQNIFAKRSTDVTWDDLKSNNVIIMGKPEADPTIARWMSRGHFIETSGQIRNLHPAPGEAAEWNDDPGSSGRNWKQKYALVTMMPGPGKGNWIVSMSGSGSEHPWAMADYLTGADNARELIRHLRLPSGNLPSAYQVVIRADFRSQTPVKVTYVTHRSLDITR